MGHLPSGPGDSHIEITPNDDTDIDPNIRALKIGIEGDIVIRDKNGVDVTYTVVAGEIIPFAAKRVLATGTTAQNIVGWR